MVVMWFEQLPALLVGLLFLIIPGLIVAYAVGQRGVRALALSPMLSVGVIVVAATFFPLVGMRWSFYQPFVIACASAAVGWGVVTLLRYRGIADSCSFFAVRARESFPQDMEGEKQRYFFAALAISFVLLSVNIIYSIGNPQWYSQTFDANFHVNAIRYIADYGNSSSLFIKTMTNTDAQHGFYPAAWHAVTSLIYMYSGSSVAVSANIMSLMVGAVIWPLSLLYFMRSLVRFTAPIAAMFGVLSAAFFAFPVLLIEFGVLYANSLGIALLPMLLALALQFVRVGTDRSLDMATTVYLLMHGVAAVSLAHPNVLVTFFVFGAVLVLTRVCLQWERYVAHDLSLSLFMRQIGLAFFYMLVTAFLWCRVRPKWEDGSMWSPVVSAPQAIGEAVWNSGPYGLAQWTVSLLTLIGAYCLVRTKKDLWLPGLWGFAVFFYVLARSLPWENHRYFWVGLWYHDSFRLFALIPVFAVPLAILGAVAIGEVLVGLRARTGRVFSLPVSVLAVVLVVALGVVTQLSPALREEIARSHEVYEPTAQSKNLSVDELDVIARIPEFVPQGDRIINQPWTGSAMAYASSGREVLAAHIFFTPSSDARVIYQELNRAYEDPAVCQAVKNKRAYYYLDFGVQEVHSGDHTSTDYPGLKGLRNTRVVEPVYTKGNVGLYKVVACQ